MNQTVAPPIPSLVPETAPFSDGAARVAERLLRRPRVARRRGRHRAVARAERRADAGRRHERIRRHRRRRSAVARPDPAARRAHDARRRPPAAPPDDGGDGAAGLRPVRLQLRGLFEPHRHQERRAAEPVRAGRQGNRPHAEVAVRGTRQGAARSLRRESRRRAGCADRAAVGRRRATIPRPATFLSRTRLNRAGSEKETWHIEIDLAGIRHRLHGRRFVRPVSRPTIPRWSTPSSRRSTRRRISRSAGAPCARC